MGQSVARGTRLRRGGQAVDFRGPALTVLEYMGILDRIRERDTGTDFAHYLGCCCAYWETDNQLGLDNEGMATGDGRTAALSVFTVDDNAHTRTGLASKSDHLLPIDSHDRRAQAELLKARAAHLGRDHPRVRGGAAPGYPLHSAAQAHARLSRGGSPGRIVLVP
ncbi:hypothetical protein ACFVTC_37075 [Streptomyces sp. NPDC057950]|uniref:hypothetical protein n=1 Tax=Streptomyces sp. NPDC057950 TaxID=3346288 RepID=UPI0036ED6CD7